MSETTATAKTTKTPRRPAAGRARNPQPDPVMIEALTSDEAGIDYAPAIEAIDDLLGWAFELARKDVAEWSEGTRRVRNAHRYVRALLRGKSPRTEPREDLLFTAALLVRIFEGEIGLSVDHVAALLDQLGLPLDHAPAVRPAPVVSASHQAIAPSVWRHLRAIHAALPPIEAAAARDEAARLSVPERDAWIAALKPLTVEMGAGMVSAYLRGDIEAPPPRRALHVAMPVDACVGCGVHAAHFRRVA